MGRTFKLRDLGYLDEALACCREAIELAGPVTPDDTDDSSLSTKVIGALTIDEIATKLGQVQLAREPLASALLSLQSFNQSHRERPVKLFVGYERQIRDRLAVLR